MYWESFLHDRYPQSPGRDANPFKKACYADPHKNPW